MTIILLLLLVILVLCSIFVTTSKNNLNAVIIFMAYSTVMSIVWNLLQSPDLAITEAAVGAGISSVLFFIALKRIDAIEEDKAKASDKRFASNLKAKKNAATRKRIEEVMEDKTVQADIIPEGNLDLDNPLPAFLQDKVENIEIEEEIVEKTEESEISSIDAEFAQDVQDLMEKSRAIISEVENKAEEEKESVDTKQAEDIAMAVLADMKKRPTKRRRR